MEAKIQQLIYRAKRRMKQSPDPVHDVRHAERVVGFVKELTRDLNLTADQRQALILAAWWHDLARTVTKNPSLVWMPFFDDLLSAFMLWGATIRYGLFGTVAGLATRIIFCKSLGTGALLTRFLMRRKNRMLVDLIKDADNLDALNLERINYLMVMVETSRLYHVGYRLTIWWYIKSSQLKMRTMQARLYLEGLLRAFLEWAKQQTIFNWHVAHFGRAWCEKMLLRGEALLHHIKQLNALATV